MVENATAVVSSVRQQAGSDHWGCTAVLTDGSIALMPETVIELYDEVAVADGRAKFLSNGRKALYSRRVNSLVRGIGIKHNAEAALSALDARYSNVFVGMRSGMESAAASIARAYISGAPISVRFHADGDGAAAAVSLHRAFSYISGTGIAPARQVSWHPVKENFYSAQQLEIDTLLSNGYSCAERPLLVIADFGTARESLPQISAASDRFEIVWIDHHSIPAGFKPGRAAYINPLMHGGNASISAGLVASVLASFIGADTHDLAAASLVSDMSMYADAGDAHAAKVAEALDYMTARGSEHVRRPKGMEAVLQDPAALDSMYTEVRSMLERSIAVGMKSARTYECAGGLRLFVVNFEKIKALGLEYPPPGRYASRLQHALEAVAGQNIITMVYYRSYISIRVCRSVSAKVGLISAISELEKATNGAVTGGGHMEAASVAVGDYGMDNVLSLLLHRLGAKPKQ